MSDLVSTFNQKNAPYFLDENWTWYYWKDIISSYQQGLIRSNSELNEIDGIDYFKMNFINENGTYTFNGLPKTFATSEEIDNYKIKNGDFFINVRNSKELVGKSCVVYDVNKNILFNHMLVRINHKEYVTGSFINAYFNTKFGKKLIETCKKGTTTVIALYQKDLYNIPIPIPKKKILEGIDEIYNSINKKIELNNRINAELEAMAKTLYDYWFVQFDFPNAENKPYKTSGGKMVHNETLKREIPEGWEVKKLEDIEEKIVTGKTPSTKVSEYFNGNIPFITIDDIRKQFYIFNAERNLTISGAESQVNKYVYSGDICVSCIGTIGIIGIVATTSQTNQQINTISQIKDYNRYFLLNSLKNYFEYNVGAKKGAVLDNMNKQEFSNILILDANKHLKELYFDKVHPLYEKIKLNLKQNQELSALRDWLLPMLMNGQVKVG